MYNYFQIFTLKSKDFFLFVTLVFVTLRYISIQMKKREYHGSTHTQLYKRWDSMRSRIKPTWTDRKHYFDKGIVICKEWEQFSNFKIWALENGFQEGLEIDRKDNKGNYEPSNCRWVTRLVNNCNRSNTIFVTYLDETLPLPLLAEKLGWEFKKYDLIRRRLKRGWSIDKAINQPIETKFYKKI